MTNTKSVGNMTDPHTPKYEWTDGGKQLLSEILIRIEIYGGREKLARDIEAENKRITTNHWQPYEVKTLLANKYDLELAAKLTGRTVWGAKDKMRRIKETIKIKQNLFK